jgi:type III restriction enzyme
MDAEKPALLDVVAFVEIKGYRGENAKEKANAMRAYWVPGVNNLGKFGRWALVEFAAVYEIEPEFAALIGRFTKNQAAA